MPLAANTSCTVDMYFYPGALGARNADLTLNDPAAAGTSITLQGTGGIGYYQVSSNGAVGYAGDAGFYGDASNVTLNHPIVGMAQTGDDGGYWLVASDGGIFNYGDAPFYGSTGGLALNKPIVGMAGELRCQRAQRVLVGRVGWRHLQLRRCAVLRLDGQHPPEQADRGHGCDARRWRLLAGRVRRRHLQLRRRAVLRLDGRHPPEQADRGHGPDADGAGYWLVASDGGIFSYGDAQFYGSAGALPLAQPIVGMAGMPDGSGYWFSAGDGGLFNYGDAPFYGSGTGQGVQVVGHGHRRRADLSGPGRHPGAPPAPGADGEHGLSPQLAGAPLLRRRLTRRRYSGIKTRWRR